MNHMHNALIPFRAYSAFEIVTERYRTVIGELIWLMEPEGDFV